MKTTRLLLIICLFANTLSIAAQENPEKPEKIEKGWEFIDAQEFREAVSLMNDYMKQDSVNAEAYHLRGNAYFDLELYDSALIDYLNAIRVDSLYSSAYYNVANTLEIQEDYAKAESYFEQYMAMAPGDADGYLRLAIIKSYLSKPTKDLLVKTLELDSQNITALYYLSMEYLREADYEASIELAEKGKVWYPQQPAFAQVSGLNHYEMGEYQKAAKDFDFVLSLDPVDFSALDMKVRIELLLKTPKELYTKEKDEIRFVPANGNTLLDWVNRQDVQESQYDFEQIKSLMMAGESLSIDQYLYFYVKQKDQPDYGPYYSGVRKTLSDQYNKEEYEKMAEMAPTLYDESPVNIDALYKVSIAFYELKQIEDLHRYYKTYLGLVQSILTLGDGLSAEEALMVMSTSDEYSILGYLGEQNLMQSLIHDNGHSYDALTVKKGDEEDESDEDVSYYFNIDLPFNSLSKSFDSGPKERSKKEKRKEKKKKRKDKRKKSTDESNG